MSQVSFRSFPPRVLLSPIDKLAALTQLRLIQRGCGLEGALCLRKRRKLGYRILRLDGIPLALMQCGRPRQGFLWKILICLVTQANLANRREAKITSSGYPHSHRVCRLKRGHQWLSGQSSICPSYERESKRQLLNVMERVLSVKSVDSEFHSSSD
jgi:hypothetical protein